jgi:hypothetical protein
MSSPSPTRWVFKRAATGHVMATVKRVYRKRIAP